MKKGLGKCEATWPDINMKGNKTKWLKEKSEKKNQMLASKEKYDGNTTGMLGNRVLNTILYFHTSTCHI